MLVPIDSRVIDFLLLTGELAVHEGMTHGSEIKWEHVGIPGKQKPPAQLITSSEGFYIRAVMPFEHARVNFTYGTYLEVEASDDKSESKVTYLYLPIL